MRRPLAMAAVATVVAVVAGCAQIPTSGPVERGDLVQGSDDEPSVRVLPRGPVPGQSATAVVRGFLDASASFENDHAVARRFLTAGASAKWRPEAGVSVIDDNPRRRFASEGEDVVMRAQETARISGDGAYSPRGGTEITRRFPMKRVDGEWRIARAPQGLILDRIEASLAFRSFDLFFVNSARTFLVPDPVYLPIEPSGSATSLVKALLAGPTRWLRPAADSLIPAGTTLVVDSVPIENGVAQVDLSAEFLDAEPDALNMAAAQITATLLELSSSVSGVSISVEGSALQLPDEPAVFTADTWDRYETDALTPTLGLVFVRNGVVEQLTGGEQSTVEGPLGSGRLAVREPSQSWDGQTVTALNAGRTRLLVTHPLVSARVEDTVAGRRLLPATIDGDGRLWSVDVGRPDLVVRYLDGTRWRRAVVKAPRGDVTSFCVSPDGTRMAMVVQRRVEPPVKSSGSERGELLVGRVVRGAERLRVEAFRRTELTLTDVSDVSWVSATTMAVVATTARAPEPMLVDIDRTVTPLSADVLVSVTAVVGAPGLPLVADTPSDGLWQSDGAEWQALVRGRDPAYPG